MELLQQCLERIGWQREELNREYNDARQKLASQLAEDLLEEQPLEAVLDGRCGADGPSQSCRVRDVRSAPVVDMSPAAIERRLAEGGASYRALLESVTLSPAMGLYLNMSGSQKENAATGRLPDENYAREVMQLFSIGLVELGSDGTPRTDANGRFDLETAIAYAKMLRDYPLFWYEEAGDPLDYALQAALADFYPAPMATGENLFSHQDARNLLRYGGMRPDRDYLQFDCALSYGLVEYLRTLQMLRDNGWSPRRC